MEKGTAIPSNSIEKSYPVQRNVLKFGKVFKKIFMNTILVHLVSLCISFFLTFFRDQFFNQICWSPKLECSCDFGIAIYYIFLSVFFEILCPISLLNVIMFVLQQSLANKWQTKVFFVFEMILAVLVPYILSYYYQKGSPRMYTYIITSTMAIFYSIFVKQKKKLSWSSYLQKLKYPVYFVYSALLYFIIIVYVLPIAYYFMENIAENNTENVFQVVLCILVAFYEIFIDYVFNRIAETIEAYGNNNILIILAKYYYIMFYSLRVGNILFLQVTEWGFYFQFCSFFLFFITQLEFLCFLIAF